MIILLKNLLRLYEYSVISTPTSVIYMAGNFVPWGSGSINYSYEYKNHKFTNIGPLGGARIGHRSIMMDNWVYTMGGDDA